MHFVLSNDQTTKYINKLNDKGCSGAPDWIIEIVSPSSIQMNYMLKLFRYRRTGVREYWIVDPFKQIFVRPIRHKYQNIKVCKGNL